jgi:hypothetical protein
LSEIVIFVASSPGHPTAKIAVGGTESPSHFPAARIDTKSRTAPPICGVHGSKNPGSLAFVDVNRSIKSPGAMIAAPALSESPLAAPSLAIAVIFGVSTFEVEAPKAPGRLTGSAGLALGALGG